MVDNNETVVVPMALNSDDILVFSKLPSIRGVSYQLIRDRDEDQCIVNLFDDKILVKMVPDSPLGLEVYVDGIFYCIILMELRNDGYVQISTLGSGGQPRPVLPASGVRVDCVKVPADGSVLEREYYQICKAMWDTARSQTVPNGWKEHTRKMSDYTSMGELKS